jgi:hypothetical protein
MAFDAGSITSTLGLDMSGYARGMLQAEAITRIFPETVQTFLANPLLLLPEIAERAMGGVVEAVKRGYKGLETTAGEFARVGLLSAQTDCASVQGRRQLR